MKFLHDITCIPSSISKEIKGFSVDTRLIMPGDIYVALKGEKVDGHEFLGEAKAKGASAALVAQSYAGPDHGLFLICVKDPLKSFQDITRNVIKSWNPRIVAITGSVGKTTTKDFITTFLRTKYSVASTPGNSNSQVGIPLAVLNTTKGDEEILVLEMGMTLPGHIKNLLTMAAPEVAVITTVALVHACSFDSLEEIARTKAEIFEHPMTKRGVMPFEIVNKAEIEGRGSCKKTTFSLTNKEADYFLESESENRFQDNVKGINCKLGALSIMGKHNRHNMLAAAAVARHFDVSMEDISRSMSSLQLPDKRLQLVEKRGILFVNDSYNAAEISVKAALDAIPAPQKRGKRIAVLGSMMELGKFSDECHYRVGEHALNNIDRLYCYGIECTPMYELWKQKNRPAHFFLDRDKMIDQLRQELEPNDVVLLKGSRSKQLWKVLEEI